MTAGVQLADGPIGGLQNVDPPESKPTHFHDTPMPPPPPLQSAPCCPPGQAPHFAIGRQAFWQASSQPPPIKRCMSADDSAAAHGCPRKCVPAKQSAPRQRQNDPIRRIMCSQGCQFKGCQIKGADATRYRLTAPKQILARLRSKATSATPANTSIAPAPTRAWRSVPAPRIRASTAEAEFSGTTSSAWPSN